MRSFQRSPAARIRGAITSLLATNRFFGVLALRLRVQPGNVKTIAGDGLTLTYSEEWVAEAPHDQIKGAVAHIVFGCALKHHVRRGDRDYNRWQRASREATAELLRREDIWVPDPGATEVWRAVWSLGRTGASPLADRLELPLDRVRGLLDDLDARALVIRDGERYVSLRHALLDAGPPSPAHPERPDP